MNYNHLYYFYTTARLGGVSKAALVLNISQPSLSVQLKTFEAQIGKKLFQKFGRGVQLSLDGERAFKHCQKIFAAVGDFEIYLKGQDLHLEKLKIGISAQIESPFVADLFSVVYQKNKKMRPPVQIVSGTQNQLLEQLQSAEIDMMLTNSFAYSNEFQVRAEINMPVGLFISKSKFKEISKEKFSNCTLKELLQGSDFGFVLPSVQQRLRHEIDIYLQHYLIQNRIALESDILAVVARALVDGVGIGFLPIPYVAAELKLKQLIPLAIKEKFWDHKFYVLTRREEGLDPLFEELILTIRQLEKKPLIHVNKINFV